MQGETILMRLEEYDTLRTIHMDGAGGSANRQPSILGYSTGRWEGDTLVIETTDVNWGHFDTVGIPLTDRARIVERFILSDGGLRLGLRLSSGAVAGHRRVGDAACAVSTRLLCQGPRRSYRRPERRLERARAVVDERRPDSLAHGRGQGHQAAGRAFPGAARPAGALTACVLCQPTACLRGHCQVDVTGTGSPADWSAEFWDATAQKKPPPPRRPSNRGLTTLLKIEPKV